MLECYPSSPFLRAFWFFRIVCGHYVRRGESLIYIAMFDKICLSGDGSKPLSVNHKWLATFSYASYLPLPSRSLRLLGIAPAGMFVSSNTPSTSRPGRSFLRWVCVVSVTEPTLSGSLRLLCSWRGDFPQPVAVGRPPSPDC